MANEIQHVTSLSVTNGSVSYSATAQDSADQTTQGAVVRKQTITTSDTVVTLTGVTTPRFAHIKNLDATNYVKFGPTVAGAIAPLFRVLAGESWSGPLEPGVVLRAQANTASVIIEFLLTET